MNEWMTPQEIADAQLTGMPATKRRVNELIKREGWERFAASVRQRTDRGGTITEYHLRLLPLAARLDIIGRSLPEIEQEAPASPEELATLGATSVFRRDARAAIVKAADKLHDIAGMWFSTTDQDFCALYEARKAPVPDWVYGVVTTISPRSIARWRQAVQRGARDRLAGDPSKNRAGTGVLDTAEDGRVKKFCLALVAKNPHLAAKHVRATVAAEFGETLSIVNARTGEIKDVDLPPLRSFQHALKTWKHEHRHELTYLTDPDGYRSKVQFAATGATVAARLNELWEIDASPADVMTTDGRHSIYACVDIYSRRMKILVSKTPTSAAVGLLIRNSLLDWGVPERIKTDNGSDFTSYQTRRLFAELDIEQEICPPFSPHKKGVVERHIRTFQHDLARMMPGFVGHSVADRKV
ncbi:MAG: transposase family protein, partial [Rhodobiaceae bacterium]|nr:transposase family protein [Rhodobiaceae bacterium]